MRDEDLKVRKALAYCTGWGELLLRLAGDAEPAIRRAVADNEAAPPEVLRVLAADSDSATRSVVAGNANAPAEVLNLNPPFWLGGGDFGGG